MFAPTRGLSGMADSMQPCKILQGRPLLPWQRHVRQVRSLIAYRLVCLYVCNAPSNRLFFFVSQQNRAIFGVSFLRVAHYKIFPQIFDLGPLTQKFAPQNFGTKSPITRLVRQTERRCLHLLGGFSGMADSMEPYKMLWGRPLLPWQRNFGKFGLLLHTLIQIDSSFFVSRWNRAIFGTSFLRVALYKTLFLHF